jgi:hypothetical protein
MRGSGPRIFVCAARAYIEAMRLLVIVMGALLALTLWGFFSGWAKLDWDIGVHGWIALTLGVVLSFALGGGLMALSFHSARHGYDDRIEPLPGSEPDDDR